MKKVLSLLVIFVFLNVQSWAFAPQYGSGTSTTSVSGTYAGVFMPLTTTATVTSTTTTASLGIFGIGIPSSSSSSPFVQGAGALFINGAGYNLTIVGTYDPQSSTLQAIVDGVSDFTVTVVVAGAASQFSLFAQGSILATLTAADSGRSASNGGSSAGTANAERINGTASLDLYRTTGATGPNITSTSTFTVTGFQQSSTVNNPTVTLSTGG